MSFYMFCLYVELLKSNMVNVFPYLNTGLGSFREITKYGSLIVGSGFFIGERKENQRKKRKGISK